MGRKVVRLECVLMSGKVGRWMDGWMDRWVGR